jgi:hypothetical protein
MRRMNATLACCSCAATAAQTRFLPALRRKILMAALLAIGLSVSPFCCAADAVAQPNPASTSAIEAYLKRQFKDVAGVEVARNSDGLEIIEISGAVRQARDCGKVRRLLAEARSRWGKVIAEAVTYQPDFKSIQQAVLEALASAKVEQPSVDVAADVSRIALGGTVYTEAQAAEASRLADIQIRKLDLQEVTLVPGLRVDATTFEVEAIGFEINDGLSKDIGLDLINMINGKAVATGTWGNGAPNYAVVATLDLDQILKTVANDTDAVVLHRFTVVTQNGQEGHSMTGEEIRVPVYREYGASPSALETIPVGAIAKAKVTRRDAETVQLKIDCDLSSLVQQNLPTSVTVARRYVNDTVDVPLNSQVILRAYEGTHTAQAQSGTPGARRVPVFRWFFSRRAKSDNKNYSGLLVIVRKLGAAVTVDPSVSARTEEVLKQVRERLAKRRGKSAT